MEHLPNIVFNVVKHKNQRYDTCGDYIYRNADYSPAYWQFKVSKTSADYEFLIFMHELTEWYLTQKRGIKEESITKFDLWHLDRNLPGEAGNHRDAPYRKEHKFSTRIEKLLAKELGVDWEEYDKVIDKLKY